MPPIERSVSEVTLDPYWLGAYRACAGLPPEVSASLPPLALQIAAAPLHLAILADFQFPFKAFGLVHVAQSVVQTEPIAPRQTLGLRAYTSTVNRVRRGTQFGLVTEALVDGRVVWRSETTVLAKDATLPAQSLENHSHRCSPQENAPIPPWNAIATVNVPESLGRRYAAMAGDLNPIHQHALLARAFGFPRAIIHGTWTLARGLAAAALPSTPSYRLTAEFHSPVFLPSTIVIATRKNEQCEELKIVNEGGAITHVNAQVSAAPFEDPQYQL